MNQIWKRLTALGLTAWLALSLVVLPAQATQVEEQEVEVLVTETEEEAAPAYVPALRQDHVRYMQGFPEGTFKPENQLTRAQAAQLVYRLLEHPDWGYGDCSYVDVPQWEWYAQPVTALCRLGLFDDGWYFRPNDIITRAEFVDLLVRLRPDAYGTAVFPDVPGWHWAADAIGAAVSLGWINGYPNGTFGPEKGLTRAEACTVVNRMTERAGDVALARQVIGLGIYRDVTTDYWAWQTIAEASVSHEGVAYYGQEYWFGLDLTALTFTAGVHTVDGDLYYVDRFGQLVTNAAVGAYVADETGALTQIAPSYQMPGVEYFSQIDDLWAWVGCESVATFTGLRALGYAQDVELRAFVTDQPVPPPMTRRRDLWEIPLCPTNRRRPAPPSTPPSWQSTPTAIAMGSPLLPTSGGPPSRSFARSCWPATAWWAT